MYVSFHLASFLSLFVFFLVWPSFLPSCFIVPYLLCFVVVLGQVVEARDPVKFELIAPSVMVDGFDNGAYVIYQVCQSFSRHRWFFCWCWCFFFVFVLVHVLYRLVFAADQPECPIQNQPAAQRGCDAACTLFWSVAVTMLSKPIKTLRKEMHSCFKFNHLEKTMVYDFLLSFLFFLFFKNRGARFDCAVRFIFGLYQSKKGVHIIHFSLLLPRVFFFFFLSFSSRPLYPETLLVNVAC